MIGSYNVLGVRSKAVASTLLPGIYTAGPPGRRHPGEPLLAPSAFRRCCDPAVHASQEVS